MATNEKKKSNKNLILGICAAIIVIILIVLAIVFGTKKFGLNDGSYFVSDGSKYVINLAEDELYSDNDEYTPVAAHMVYTYAGDNITSLKTYYEYETSEIARAAYEYFQSSGVSYKSVELDDKYVIVESNESDYEGVTISDVKQDVEYRETMKAINSGEESEDTSVNSGEEVEVETETETETETTEE